MNCVATNKNIRKQKRYDEGMKEAVRKSSLFLDYVLSDKLRWSNSRINQIHSTFNDVADEVSKGKVTIKDLMDVLKREHDVDVIIPKEGRIRPSGMYSDYVNGIYASSDAVSVILLYVLIHVYGCGEEKTAKVISGITYIAESVNLGYITEEEIRQGLLEEEGLEVRRLQNVRDI